MEKVSPALSSHVLGDPECLVSTMRGLSEAPVSPWATRDVLVLV